jgi:hypothetical protein
VGVYSIISHEPAVQTQASSGLRPEPNGKDPEAIASDCPFRSLGTALRGGHARIKRNYINEKKRDILKHVICNFGPAKNPIYSLSHVPRPLHYRLD